MATENLDLNINVKTAGAEGSIGSLKKQLKEAQNEVVALSDKFGATSQQAVIAAKKAAELRDRIGDAKALTDAFNPDQKFRALTSSLSGVAGGFAAVQGAMGLFGSESENLQKTLVKVQSAMALSQGLESVGNSIDSFKNLGTVIRTQVVTAFSTLRGAIIATGVGALVVGLGLLVANFKEVKETLLKVFPDLKGFGDEVMRIVNAITDFIGLTSEEGRELDKLKAKLKDVTNQYDNQIKKLESVEGTEAEIYKKKQERLDKQIEILEKTKKVNGELKEDEIIQLRDLETEKIVLANNEEKRKQALVDKEYERNQASMKATTDFEIQLANDLRKLDEKKAADKRALDFQNMENLISDLDYKNGLLDTDFAEDQQRLANKEAYIAEQKSIELSNLDLSEKERLDIIEKYAVKERQIDKDITTSKKEEKTAQVKETMKLMGDLTNFVGKDTVAGKALGIATATINTYQGASEALKQKSTLPSPFDVIAKIANVAMIIGTGIKTVKSISSVPVPNGGGGSAMPSLSNITPIIPQLPTAQITQLSQQSINDIGNNAVRAYVVESDVTSSQERITAIRQRARFS
jgi:hypothetical protein